jgi:hypothetical protein
MKLSLSIMKKYIYILLICSGLTSCKKENIGIETIETIGISLTENRNEYNGLINSNDTSFFIKSTYKITKIKLDNMVLIESNDHENKPQLNGYWGEVTYKNEAPPYIINFHFFNNTSNKNHYYSFYLKQKKINITQTAE